MRVDNIGPVEIAVPSVGFGTRYKLVVTKTRTGKKVRESGWSDNIVTNFGLDTIPIIANQPLSVSVGSGNASPSPSDLTLQNRIASSQFGSPVSVFIDEGNRQLVYRHSASFTGGSAAGNLAEIGLTANSSPWNCSCRALILDEFGAPTVITVLSDEDLSVFVEFRINQPTGDFTGTVGGLDYLIRSAYINNIYDPGVNNRGWGLQSWNSEWGLANYISTISLRPYWCARVSENGVGSITGGPSDLLSAVSYTVASAGYTSGNHFRSYNLRYLAGILSNQPIRSITYNIGPTCWQMEFGEDLIKGPLDILLISFRLAWARP